MTSLMGKRKLFGRNLSVANAYGTTVVICAGLAVGSLLLQVIVLLTVVVVARKPPPTLVQTTTGESLRVRGIKANDRDPEAIKRFTGETLTLMLSWSGFVSTQTIGSRTTSQLDPGISLTAANKKKYRLPTQSWLASFALETEFRQEFLPKLAGFVPNSVFQGQTTAFYQPDFVGEPEKIGKGQWKVDVVGTLLIFRGEDALGDVIPFNRTIYVRAITPMFERGLPSESKAAHPQLAQKVAAIRASALEIYAITEIDDKEIGSSKNN